MVCAADAMNGWCCPRGDPGCNSRYAVNGVDATRACCASCAECAPLRVDVRLIGDAQDAELHHVELHGGMDVGPNGAEFDGIDDHATIEHIEYASIPEFSIGFWMTKESCASYSVYEYLYSHNERTVHDQTGNYVVPRPEDPANSNVNIYFGCEDAGGGWSTAPGSIVRFNLIDGNGGGGMFDYPVHDAGSFSDITRAWLHLILVVDTSSVATYSEGRQVQNGEYGFYSEREHRNNLAYPLPGALRAPFSGFRMRENIFVGARSDLEVHRFFKGQLAGLIVSDTVLTEQQANCFFDAGDEFLPNLVQNCADSVVPAELALSLLDEQDPPIDASGHRVTNHGGVSMSTSGASFEAGSFLTVENFEYASDATFSISLWVAKRQCGDATYEYLYSHYESTIPDTWDSSSYALIMFLCEQTGGLSSTLEGSVLRYDVHDTSGHRGVFDYSVHDAGDFDEITHGWIHVIWTVSAASMSTFIDGTAINPDNYGFLDSQIENVARPHPDQLSPTLSGLHLLSDIYLGDRFDRNEQRTFTGRMALVSVYNSVIRADEAACIFHDGDNAFSIAGGSRGRRVLAH